MILVTIFFCLLATVLHMIRRVLSGSFGSANKTASAVCGKRQRANQPWGSGAATTYVSAVPNFL